MTGRQRAAHRVQHVEERLRVRHEYLDNVAQLRHLPRRGEEIGGRARGAVPHINMKSTLPQRVGHARTDDAKANKADIFARFFWHLLTCLNGARLNWTRPEFESKK